MEKLLEILESVKPGVDFTKEENIVEDGIIDSFDIVTIVAQISDEYDIEFPVNEIIPENFNSVEALYAVIERLQND